MDFARKELLKYGWKEGQGLGKNESGINKPIKTNLKLDLNGIGYKPDEGFNWWEYVFNKTADGLSVNNRRKTDDSSLTVKRNDFEISTQRPKKKRKADDLIMRTFCKESKNLSEVEKKELSILDEENESSNKYIKTISDDELYKICEGRTAHKGARHGLKLSGKLARLAQQDSLVKQDCEKVLENSKIKCKRKNL